ncbi:Adenylate cyclase [hydrothermal vent metagenome]|uniref:Adenylate cyclase n=1 Tax=hydrothermal vent metagenome TaxID=652676 RepID=A0A3B0SAY0_9ZZZZ
MRSARMVSLLEYVVSKTLDGQQDKLKAYSIGLDVFGISPDADPEKSAVVRVEMGRLRTKLERYYLTAGANDPVRIEIPKGNYRPKFIAGHPTQTGGSSKKRKMVSICALLGVLVLITAGFVFLGPLGSMISDTEPRPPVVEIALFKNYSGLKAMDHMAEGLSFDIVTELARFSWLAVFVSRRQKTTEQKLSSSRAGAAATTSDYTLSGNINFTNDRVIVAYRLNETRSGIVKWSKVFDRTLSVKDIFSIQQETATAIAVEIGRPEGIVKRLEQARYRQLPKNLNSYVCTLMIYRYWHSFSDEDHRKTRQCLEAANQKDPNFAESQAALAFIYLDEKRYGKNPRPGYEPLKRSLATAKRANEIDPFSTLAKQALFTASMYAGDLEVSEKVGRQAIELAPNNPELLADVGNKLALFAGKWDRGLKFTEKALRLNSDPAPWYFTGLAYRNIVEEDYQQALKWAKRINAPGWLHFHLIRLISFAGLNDKVRLRAAVAGFEKIGVRSADDAVQRIEMWAVQETLRELLKAKVKAAYAFAERES